MAKLADLTDKQLEQEAFRLQREKDKLRAEQLKVRAETDRRFIRARAEQLAAGLGNPELVAEVLPGVAGAKGRDL